MFDPLIEPWRLHWTADGVDVFHIDLQRYGEAERNAFPWLSAGERARSRNFVCPQARRQFTICRGSLRALLTERLGCQPGDLAFSTDHYGKPSALVCGRRAPLEFNVSHTGGHGLIALSTERPVGVDVEDVRTLDVAGIAETVFTAAERALLQGRCRDDAMQRFFRLWTLKEAVVKAVGMGLSLDLKSFSIPRELVCESGSSYLSLATGRDMAGDHRLHIFTLPDVGQAAAALAMLVQTVPEYLGARRIAAMAETP